LPETRQRILPGLAQPLPEGFVYASAVVSVDQEAELLQHFRQLAFREFEFHGYQGRRRVVYFGYRYDFNESTLARISQTTECRTVRRVAAGIVYTPAA
jgi:hypothetical protein